MSNTAMGLLIEYIDKYSEVFGEVGQAIKTKAESLRDTVEREQIEKAYNEGDDQARWDITEIEAPCNLYKSSTDYYTQTYNQIKTKHHG